MKILIADDHPLTLQGTRNFVESCGYEVLDACSDGSSAWEQIQIHLPEIAILDINMPGLDGMDVARKVQENQLTTKVILLTMHNEKTIYNRAKSYGVYGYILKECILTELKNCLEEVLKGNHFASDLVRKNLLPDLVPGKDHGWSQLTFTERKIMELVIRQKTSGEMAALLFLSEQEIENHQHRMMEKLKLPDGKDILFQWAMRNQPR